MATKNIRAALVADPDLGAGNVLAKLIEHGADLDGPGLTFDVDVDGRPAWQDLTLGGLHERVLARAAWLHRRGVRPRDLVAVHVSSSADLFLSFLALSWLGATPAFLNPHVPPDIAAEYLRRLRCTGVLLDAAHLRALAGHDLGAPILGDVAETGLADPAGAPAAYRHHPNDPIAVTHSSGTTRMPTAVVHSHSTLFAATRRIRLSVPVAQGTQRVLSALPAAHAAGIGAINQALCNRAELLWLSRQDQGEVVLDAIERWRPHGVFGFAVTWSELARFDLSRYRLDSVSLWFNTGDCAHEPHIRRLVAVGSREVVTRAGVTRVPGSSFIDGLGSTEMGHSAFYITHRADTDRYGRCVGKPHIFADVALLDPETGAQVPVGEVGHLGLTSPTIAVGYWNNHAEWYRQWSGGRYLTGDLMYRDADGYYYHVDRAVDAVDLGGGQRLYTAMSEERVLAACPEVRDATVVAVATAGQVVTDVLLQLHTGAGDTVDLTERVRAALPEAVAATLRKVIVVADEEIIFGPTGKVRKFLMRQRHLAELGAA
ncbi:class I adenylate-forming enzyme family protein [Catellatospora sp. KI3]|uniref:class I adenylate-forming enzyme family protein n=1 Tax=Catellatospora sp. KI3 TaxID=3041620 RepID=UPI00248312BD|nr:class I adenylate-forming enzyme family protein [Catellatospora sp. KI3]MDI1463586.1 class I adenylate-forming enzyme family protein [Catellatospora sp. KI3]